ncbi:cathepsin L2-like isoform X2 [Notamacropus eugenii]|uniref:cathepsin L2-like isoform X2 n=1 Tax=Notamacropus eugenii TaxID=9315 RepID=UPI003B67F49D
MNFYLCLASLCMVIAAAAPQFNHTLDAKWEQWKSQHGRTYKGNEEDNWRRATWEKNLRMIEMHNREYRAGKHSFQMEMNKFGDLTNEKFRQMMNGFTQKRFQGKTKGNLFHEPVSVNLPESIDWRTKGYVTPVKNQGQCGSSWAFSATGSLEGQWFRKTGKLIPLSEQNLIDCTRSNDGCQGGSTNNAFEYVKSNGGIDSEESYPYNGMSGYCLYQKKNAVSSIAEYVNIPSANESAFTQAVAVMGPMSVTIDATHTSFLFYHSGVYYEKNCNSQNVVHPMLVVGYGVDRQNRMKYWIVKNSFLFRENEPEKEMANYSSIFAKKT